jgi:autotransporter passenger strand-loop-strand repeat protein
VSGLSVSAGGTLELVGGAALPSGATLALGYILAFGSGQGSANNNIGSGVIIELLSGGTDISATVSGGGTLIVAAGGTASGTTILRGGIEKVAPGGLDVSATVSSGGTELVSGVGTAIISGGTFAAGAIVETMSGSTAIVSGAVVNSGTLLASGAASVLEIAGGAVVSGGAVMVGSGVVDVLAGGSANITFLATGNGGLEIADTSADPTAFDGTVSGFGGANHANHTQFIDLLGVVFSAGQISSGYTSAGGSGTLTVSSGGHLVASITLIGNYSAGSFHITSGISGTVKITDPGVVNGGTVTVGSAQAFAGHGIDLPDIVFGAQTTLAYSQNGANTGTLTVGDGRHAANLALLGNYMAGSFVAAPDGHGGTLVTEQSQTPQAPLLTHPHG